MPIKVAIVEDDSALRRELLTRLNRAPGFLCVASCATAEDGLREIPPAKPDVILLDVFLPGASGMTCVEQLKQALPGTEILMLTVADDYDHVFQAMANGAMGYLVKGAPWQKILDAIKDLHEGGAPMSAPIARMVAQAFAHTSKQIPETETLTKREHQILDLVAKGRRQKEVADDLDISARTVNAHLRQIYSKLHVRSKNEAIARLQGARR